MLLSFIFTIRSRNLMSQNQFLEKLLIWGLRLVGNVRLTNPQREYLLGFEDQSRLLSALAE